MHEQSLVVWPKMCAMNNPFMFRVLVLLIPFVWELQFVGCWVGEILDKKLLIAFNRYKCDYTGNGVGVGLCMILYLAPVQWDIKS